MGRITRILVPRESLSISIWPPNRLTHSCLPVTPANFSSRPKEKPVRAASRFRLSIAPMLHPPDAHSSVLTYILDAENSRPIAVVSRSGNLHLPHSSLFRSPRPRLPQIHFEVGRGKDVTVATPPCLCFPETNPLFNESDPSDPPKKWVRFFRTNPFAKPSANDISIFEYG